MPFNYRFRFQKQGRFIFVQNVEALAIGERLLRYVDAYVKFPDFYFHYMPGGHVAALHKHLENDFFFRLDFKDFFYSISRNRVAAALHRCGFRRARSSAKWSCVRNPINNGVRYALPIGFVQSPALATLVLMGTNIARVIENAPKRGVYVSVYLDDLIGSGQDQSDVAAVFEELIEACASANFAISPKKLVAPCAGLEAFNCSLEHKKSLVTPDRILKFYSEERSVASVDAFEAYCASVSILNK